jgi:hypothetical protein
MTTRSDFYATTRTVVIVGFMLAVPFSCLLAKGVLLWMERQPSARTNDLAARVPIPA